MKTIKIIYRFSNGVTIDFTVCNSKENPITKCEWSCDTNKKNIAPLLDEYINNCIPVVYQQIADFIGESIIWIDKQCISLPQVFKPSIKI